MCPGMIDLPQRGLLSVQPDPLLLVHTHCPCPDTHSPNSHAAGFPLIGWERDRCKRPSAELADLASPPVPVSCQCHVYTIVKKAWI